MPMWAPIVFAVVTCLVAATYIVRRSKLSKVLTAPPSNSGVTQHDALSSAQVARADFVPFQTESVVNANAAIFLLAFNVPRFDYQILGPHREVLAAAKEAIGSAVHKDNYFPRKPALLPKLLRALNAVDSSREEIVRLILQDPVLAGNVLKRANSSYYRQGTEAIESVDRAVVILGNEGLRVPVATAVMQPVFHLPRGFFDQFAPITWELAQRTAVAAEHLSRSMNAGDAFVAHLLGLLGGLGRIVLFRLTLDKYKNHNILPRAEVFIRLMMDHGMHMTRQVAQAWEMSPTFLAAIDAQIEQLLPQQMSPLSRTLYYANLLGTLAVLVIHARWSNDEALNVLVQQGVKKEWIETIWPLVCSDELL